jgi:hypothetical protein
VKYNNLKNISLIIATFIVGWIVELNKFSCWFAATLIHKRTSFQHKKTDKASDNFNNNNNNNNLNESVIDLRLKKYFFPQVGCKWFLFHDHETVCVSRSCGDRDSELPMSLW